MAKKLKKKKSSTFLESVEKLQSGNLLEPIKLNEIGSNGDPCFGQGYDLSTNECKICGDSELCCIQTASTFGKTREELEKKHSFKDLEDRIDKPGLKKYYRRLVRQDKSKKEIINAMQEKYQITLKEARGLYREFKN